MHNSEIPLISLAFTSLPIPKVFHGNTCTHDMNLVSTVSVLSRTPADINGMLSVVFIGPGKFKPDCPGPMFRIRKRKVWKFLLWLKGNN